MVETIYFKLVFVFSCTVFDQGSDSNGSHEGVFTSPTCTSVWRKSFLWTCCALHILLSLSGSASCSLFFFFFPQNDALQPVQHLFLLAVSLNSSMKYVWFCPILMFHILCFHAFISKKDEIKTGLEFHHWAFFIVFASAAAKPERVSKLNKYHNPLTVWSKHYTHEWWNRYSTWCNTRCFCDLVCIPTAAETLHWKVNPLKIL